MNFVAGFLLMTSGSREKDAFWVMAALLSPNEESTGPVSADESTQNGQMGQSKGLHGIDQSTVPRMAGLDGFYSHAFPILTTFLLIFDTLF